jgi:hypothetical protein
VPRKYSVVLLSIRTAHTHGELCVHIKFDPGLSVESRMKWEADENSRRWEGSRLAIQRLNDIALAEGK